MRDSPHVLKNMGVSMFIAAWRLRLSRIVGCSVIATLALTLNERSFECGFLRVESWSYLKMALGGCWRGVGKRKGNDV